MQRISILISDPLAETLQSGGWATRESYGGALPQMRTKIPHLCLTASEHFALHHLSLESPSPPAAENTVAEHETQT